MGSSISFNPVLTTTATGTFGLHSEGYVVGTAQPDPAERHQLAGGVLASTETLPIWGGVGISEATPSGISGATGSAQQLGSLITRATSLTSGAAGSLTGFAVFDQNYAGIQTPQSPVPIVGSGGQVNFYRLGSRARVALPLSATLAAALAGNVVTQAIGWDIVGQQLAPVETTFSAVNISAATWASTGGGQATFTIATDLTAKVFAGDDVTIASVTPSGYNGTWTVLSVTATTVVVSLPAASTPGTYSSGGTISPVNAGASLPIKILDWNIGNSLVPVYNPLTGFVTWNRAGSAALVLL